MKVPVTPKRIAAALVTAGLAATTTLPGALAPSQAASLEQVAEACPDAFPVADLAPDQPVTGLTVSKGATPEGFTGTVLGVLEDGIGPDLDMIMVRLTSTEIDRVGGIWAGMSGSPVYAEDGRLIGAVAYGLALGPSPVAGVTPAADMQQLLTNPPTTTNAAKKVDIPAALERELVSSGDATAAQAEDGLSRLPVPLGVSGMFNAKRLSKFSQQLKVDGMRVYKAGSAPMAAGPAEEIVPGGNLAGSLSYGDLSAVGTGTATMVCDGEVVAFGHPFTFGGRSSLTMHGATALYVQEDPTLFPFKVSNASGPVGVIDQDRWAGIKGVLGDAPEATTVTTKVTLPSGKTRTGTTKVSVPWYLAFASGFAQLVNQDRVFDQISGGSSTVNFTVTGTTKSGTQFALVRTNRHYSPWDISFESIFEMWDQISMVVDNEFTDVTIDTVKVDVKMTDQRRARTAQQVQIWKAGSWVKLSPDTLVRARPGGWIKIRTKLTTYRNSLPPKYLEKNFQVPTRIKPGTFGQLSVNPAAFDGGWEEGDGSSSSSPTSFAGLIKSLSEAPRNDQLVTALRLFSEEGSSYEREVTSNIGDVVLGSHSFEVKIIK